MDETGTVYQFSYYRLQEDKDYGICIQDNNGAIAIAPKVTRNRRQINTLLRLLIRGRVSPASLVDVVEDWLVC